MQLFYYTASAGWSSEEACGGFSLAATGGVKVLVYGRVNRVLDIIRNPTAGLGL